ncbi:MAG: YtxH domain-containing protein [Balneola sp.]|nr:MAG: YtxH domain-containing protein [Balneola sp.]
MSSKGDALLALISGFIAGTITGLLLAPKSGRESRQWISEHTGEAKDWVESRGTRIIKESEQKIKNISQGVKDALPDLYEATSDIHFEDDELEDA